MEKDIMIKIDSVSYQYKNNEDEEVYALDKVSLQVERGEFLAILGHNGSGKSTLAKHMNAILEPSEGKVYVKNLDTSNYENVWNIRQTAGMVFQNPDNQIVATIVEEDVAFGPENQGIQPKEIRRRVDEALDIVEMSEYKKHAPHMLSGGQKQRIAIAGVLAMNPECIIFDEPTAMLDPSGRKEVMSTINKLNQEQKKTIVLITHYMDEAVQADRVIVMENGKTVLEGTPREVFSQVEKIKKLGLDVPQVTELAYKLRKQGIKVPENVLTVKEMVDSIC
ncbi:energy-coupling factor transporter ATPase [Clostridiaceae bacterium M8S5]|nr:energy-coupling factor transporter ATPase [Clostridiaceae bacterium M8S5]